MRALCGADLFRHPGYARESGEAGMSDIYPCVVRLDGRDWVAAWDADSDTHFFLEDGRVPFFPDQESLGRWLAQRHLVLKDDSPSPADLDQARQFARRREKGLIDCPELLHVFNVCDDVALTTHSEATWDSGKFGEVYDKLFYGCNLPSVNRSGRLWRPRWTQEEVDLLADSVVRAMELLVSRSDFREGQVPGR